MKTEFNDLSNIELMAMLVHKSEDIGHLLFQARYAEARIVRNDRDFIKQILLDRLLPTNTNTKV